MRMQGINVGPIWPAAISLRVRQTNHPQGRLGHAKLGSKLALCSCPVFEISILSLVKALSLFLFPDLCPMDGKNRELSPNPLPAHSPFAEDGYNPPPPYRLQSSTSKAGHPPRMPGGRWDLACSIDEPHGFLQLDGRGEPRWTQDTWASSNRYLRDGFIITLGPSQIAVTCQAHNWTCDTNTDAGQLLTSRRETVTLRNLAQRLLIFERTIVTKYRSQPLQRPHDDTKGCLKIQSQNPQIWTITGTDIYQVEGHEDDIVVQSPVFLRLWDMAKGRWRWEKREPGNIDRIWGFTERHVIKKAGSLHMLERSTGYVHGTVALPIYQGFTDFDPTHHFGPVVSTGGLFIYKPSRKVLFIFQLGDKNLNLRIWESTDVIKGSLVVRGNLNNLELELIDQNPTWSKWEETIPVYRYDFIKKRMS